MEEGVLGFFLFGTVALLLGLTTLSVLSLSMVSDSGCLSVLIFIVGWVLSLITGVLAWAALATPIQAVVSPQGGVQISGSGSLYRVVMWTFGLGYPIMALLVRRRLESMPPEKSLTWKQALTSGALFGLGVGTAGKAFKGGSGFGGFGGGSFGGGGASGSFKGAAGSAAAKAASTAATGGASGSGQAAAGAAGAVAGRAGEDASAASEETAPSEETASSEETAPSEPPSPRVFALQGRPLQGRTWARRFRPRHGCAFILVALVFVGIGYGAAQALPEGAGTVLLVFGGGYLAYQLVRRYWREDPGSASSSTAFEGGEASSTWS